MWQGAERSCLVVVVVGRQRWCAGWGLVCAVVCLYDSLQVLRVGGLPLGYGSCVMVRV